MQRKIANFVAAGWTITEALRAATSLVVVACGFDDRDVIEVRNCADFGLVGKYSD